MRLISCHVEGFGAIRCADFKFDNSPTVFHFENGYGKSTLCAFISAMLYGFDTAKVNSQKFEDRVHYYPFDGGRFGGSLTFTEGGRVYRAERFFDKKSQTKDTFNLYIDDKPTTRESDNIGMELLGIDRESFLRVVLMDSRDSFLGSTDGINERLGKFSGGEGDLAVKDALARLDSEAKKLKVRGGGGEINRLAQEIARVRDRIENLNTIEEDLDGLYKKREALLKRCTELKAAQSDYREMNLLKEKRAAYSRLVREREEIEGRLGELSLAYHSGMPAAEEIGALSEAKREITRLEGAIAEMKEREASAEREAGSSARLKDGAPTPENIDSHRAHFAEIGEVEAEIASLVESEGDKRKRRLPILISGGALAIIGIALAFINIIAAACAGAVGIALIITSFFVKTGGESLRIAELNAKKAALIKKIEELISKYGYPLSGVLALDFASLEADAKAYNIIKKEREEREARLEEAEAELKVAMLFCREIEEKYALTTLGAGAEQTRLLSDKRERDELSLRLDRVKRELSDYIVAFGRGEELLREADGEQPSDPAALVAEVEREILNNENDITTSEDLLSEKQGLLLSLTRLNEAEAEATERLEVIKKTQEYLRRADDRMISRYVSPIRDRFLEYGVLLADYIGESFSMDRDLNLYFEAHGERRTEKHLSQGQHAIVALCMRLAIAEVIFGKDNCFLLLDDPFVALDEKHLANVASLIKRLAKTTQIVYFTCHNSRNI